MLVAVLLVQDPNLLPYFILRNFPTPLLIRSPAYSGPKRVHFPTRSCERLDLVKCELQADLTPDAASRGARVIRTLGAKIEINAISLKHDYGNIYKDF